jgi:hypothetical protein
MKNPWFKAVGWVHYPVSVPGALVTFLFLAFCVQVFMAIDLHSHSVSDTLYGIFPFIMPAFLFHEWIASKTTQ